MSIRWPSRETNHGNFRADPEGEFMCLSCFVGQIMYVKDDKALNVSK